MKKRLLLLMLIPMLAKADPVEIDGIWYNLITKTKHAEVTCGYGEYYTGAINIPASITYDGASYSVTSIGRNAFLYCASLISVTIPNSVISIGEYAFGCSGLTSITFSENLTYIGCGAFSGCSELTSITIPDSVTSIDDGAFSGCSGLTSITIGNNVTSIGESAFARCSSLKSVTIPDSVTSIEKDAFQSCSSLASITIGNRVKNIGFRAFEDCRALTFVVIGNCVTSIGDYAFYYCTSLTSVTIPNSVTKIGNSAFQGCTSLTSVNIGNSVTSIGDGAFCYCTSLTSVTIPNSVTSIGIGSFQGCTDLTSITIGTGVTSIGKNSFIDCTNLKKTIWLTNTPPSGYTYARGEINYVSNDQYTNLSNRIVYPFLSSMFEVDGVYYVPVNPSERICDAIDCRQDETVTNMNISSTVSYKGITMYVKNVQFYFCYNNKFIENLICNNDGYMFPFAFYGCVNLTSAVCNTENIGNSAFYGCVNLTSAVCNTENIGISAFYGCTKLRSLSLGEKVSSIGNSSFRDCSSLQSVFIPDSVNTLGNYAFSGCSSLISITLGNHVKTIGSYMFQYCNRLSVINIPASINSINDYAFGGCTKLKTLIIADRETELSLGSNGSYPLFSDCPLDSVYIGGNITYNTSSSYGYSPFYRNTLLRTVVISDKETEISPYEFYGCTNLQNFTIGDGVTSFGDWAFSGCSSLKNLSFGSHLASIGKEAFSDCNSVTQIVSKAVTPPSCGTQALDDINKWECNLYVPDGAITSYQKADQWKEFFFMQVDPDVLCEVKEDDNLSGVTSYDLQGRMIAKPQKGINIIRYSDGTSKKVAVK